MQIPFQDVMVGKKKKSLSLDTLALEEEAGKQTDDAIRWVQMKFRT